VTFTPIVGVSSYDTRDTTVQVANVTTTVLSRPLCFVRNVTLNGNFLNRITNFPTYGIVPGYIYSGPVPAPGPSSESMMAANAGIYQTAPNGLPSFWWQEPSYTIRFSCPFDQIYSNCWLTGRCFHTPYSGIATQTIDFGDVDTSWASQRCAARLILPYSRDKGMQLMAACEQWEAQRSGQMGAKLSGPMQRGRGRRGACANLTW
jgi:hypothetical protein